MNSLLPYLALPLSELLMVLVLSAAPVILWMVAIRRPAFHLGWSALGAFLIAALFSQLFQLLPPEWFLGEILSRIGAFLLLGIAIEYGKNFIVQVTGRAVARNFDDVLDLSFLTALGFVFGESLYQLSEAFLPGGEFTREPLFGIAYYSEVVFYLTPVHLFSSGIFGFFYGLGLFASDALRRPPYISPLAQGFIKILRKAMTERTAYRIYQTLLGTLYSVTPFALFFLIYSGQPSLQTIVTAVGLPYQSIVLELSLMPVFALGFFYLGTILLFSNLDRIRRHRRDDLLLGEEHHSEERT